MQHHHIAIFSLQHLQTNTNRVRGILMKASLCTYLIRAVEIMIVFLCYFGNQNIYNIYVLGVVTKEGEELLKHILTHGGKYLKQLNFTT